MQDRLKQIGRGEPGKIQIASEWFGEIPSDNYAISQLPHVARAGHPGLQKYADGWCMFTQLGGHFSEKIKSSNGGSNSSIRATVRINITHAQWRTESNGSRCPHRKRTPPLP